MVSPWGFQTNFFQCLQNTSFISSDHDIFSQKTGLLLLSFKCETFQITRKGILWKQQAHKAILYKSCYFHSYSFQIILAQLAGAVEYADCNSAEG